MYHDECVRSLCKITFDSLSIYSSEREGPHVGVKSQQMPVNSFGAFTLSYNLIGTCELLDDRPHRPRFLILRLIILKKIFLLYFYIWTILYINIYIGRYVRTFIVM